METIHTGDSRVSCLFYRHAKTFRRARDRQEELTSPNWDQSGEEPYASRRELHKVSL